MQSNNVGDAFILQSRLHLKEDFLPKILRCLEQLTEPDIWWRAHQANNSAGNLVLHLAGNVRQWIISGLGGAEDKRHRALEFAERGPLPKAELLAKLEETLAEADKVLANFPSAQLTEERTIQGFRKTGLQTILHVVEHFSFHTGQIIYITKLRLGVDLKFYDL